MFKATTATVRSTSFISAFVALYMGTACLSRRIFQRDHRAMYYFAGIILAVPSSGEEDRSRAGALPHPPRDSFASTVIDKKLLPRVPHAELALFCVTAGLCTCMRMSLTRCGVHALDDSKVVHRPNAPLPHSASEAMIQAVGDEDSDTDNGSPKAKANAP